MKRYVKTARQMAGATLPSKIMLAASLDTSEPEIFMAIPRSAYCQNISSQGHNSRASDPDLLQRGRVIDAISGTEKEVRITPRYLAEDLTLRRCDQVPVRVLLADVNQHHSLANPESFYAPISSLC